MGNHRITGLTEGVNPTDAATVSQIQAVADVSEAINQAVTKSTPADSDRFIMTDSAASFVLKKLTWGNIKSALEGLFAPLTRTISTAGLATGGGDLSADRTITVPIATQAQAEAGTNNTTAMTPLRTQQAINENLSGVPGFYTGGSSSNTNFPIGQYLNADLAAGSNARNAATNDIRLGAADSNFTTAGSGSILNGTWRAKGTDADDSSMTLINRTA